jgi:glycosyltransferase involved in cell wall biosynthesis
MITGLVTTIIPVFNRPALLREAVQSVLEQTYQPIEIVIVDDGSTNSTPEVIHELEKLVPGVIRVISQANSGPGGAREAGRQTAQGEFIQYLDSDDLLLPRKFEVQVAALREHPECGIAYGMTQFVRVGQIPTREAHKGTADHHEFLFPALLLGRFWYTNTPLYRRSFTDRIGPWRAFWNEEDWEYDARAAALGAKLCYCDEFVSIQRSHQPDQHLCYQGASDPRKLKDRTAAHELILAHARTAGIGPEVPEMRHFARELFLLSRQCGAVGLTKESRELFSLARTASSPERARGWDFRLYGIAAGLLGWDRIGWLACYLDRFRT